MSSDRETFDFELETIASQARQRDSRKILLQFPEGLKRRAFDVSRELSEMLPDVQITVSGEPCFGACDIPLATDADLIINFGHLPIPNLGHEQDIIFIQARCSADPIPIIEKALRSAPELGDKIGIITTSQHVHRLADISGFLSENGKRPVVGKGGDRVYADGQILGCNVSAALSIAEDVDSFLYVGSGNFHPLAVSLSTTKPVIIADPLNDEVRTVDDQRDTILRQRHAQIELARSASRFGIIISMKPGQRREETALAAHDLLSESGKTALLVEMDQITPEKLSNFGLEAWVSTACPRLALDDQARYPIPVLTPPELEIVLGRREWDDYGFDAIS